QIAVDGFGGATGSIVLKLVEVLGPPVFLTEPQAQTARAGTSVSFDATVTGAGPFSFQWRKDGVDIPGANGIQNGTNTTYAIASAATNQTGIYTVLASNAYGTTISAPAFLNVFLRPDNDAYLNAFVLTGQAASGTGNNTYATADGFEPTLFAGRSVW